MGFLSVEGAIVEKLEEGWTMALTDAGACAGPAQALAAPDWIAARVPGTAAGALFRAGRFYIAAPTPLHDKDVWYRRSISGEGRRLLRFQGLATFCEVYLDDRLILTSTNMFLAHELEVELSGAHRLVLVFRALSVAFAGTKPRARWRAPMIANQGSRHVRATLLGQMPGWQPSIETVGPWRPITLIAPATVRPENLRIASRLVGEDGQLQVVATLRGVRAASLICGDSRVAMQAEADGRFSAALTIAQARPWRPHTHGEPFLYPLAIEADGKKIDLGNTGFRAITIDRGADGKDFAVRVNDEKIFCRGAAWTPANLLDPPSERAHYRPALLKARDANMNMIRISGVGVYESRDFFEICDELGLLVWSDFMFANFDYPLADAAFAASCRAEAESFLQSTQGCPSLALLCGGSEIMQQAAMMGLPADKWRDLPLNDILRAVGGELRPDAPFVENSPSGGPLPFVTDEGVTHYYGVGAYERPLEDARRADVRFAAECLAFANIPQQDFLDRRLPSAAPHQPRWKAGVPRDMGASWDFEDTREFYLKLLYGVDPARLRRENLAVWFDASRAVSGEVMEATFAEWRRGDSRCNGALVWTLQDLTPGAGWGVLDADGAPKPAYYALKRAFAARQIVLSDEGANGLVLHVLNETERLLAARVEFTCWQDGRLPVVRQEKEIDLAPRGADRIAVSELIGAFFDTNYAYRFGPPAHDLCTARLFDRADGELLAEAFHFPQGRSLARDHIEFSAELIEDENGWRVDLETPRALQSTHIFCPGFEAQDDWFHLAPKIRRSVRLAALAPDARPSVEISALNSSFRRHCAA